jgi:glutamate racemase
MTRIGIFDSGVGGLSVWREIVHQWPDVETVYFADQAHIPYGSRPAEEIRIFGREITCFLLERGCEAIVVACNAASAAALAMLRAKWPHVPFVGMEPAVKPAAELSRTRVAGVLATPATFQGALFATTVERFAAEVRIVQQICPGLVERIEAGDTNGADTLALLRDFLAPSLEAGADTIVLACTHYPFVRAAIEQLAGPAVTVIDPAPAIARQLGRVVPGLAADPISSCDATRREFVTSGDAAAFEAVAALLLGQSISAKVARWQANRLS